MDIEWGNPHIKQFATIVGLITTKGEKGHNIMACEWTHHSSYSPGIIAIHVGRHKQTAQNILKMREFCVNLAGENHNIVSSVSGRSSGSEIDKIEVLKGLGYDFEHANKVSAMVLKDAVMIAECRLVETKEVGDHMMFIGEIIDLRGDPSRKPLIYFQGKYFKLGEQIQKPEQQKLDQIKALQEKHTR